MKYLTVLLTVLILLVACSPLPESPPSPTASGEQPAETVTQQPQPSQGAAGEAQVSVMFINVGRADATLVQVQGKNYLFDTGEKQSVPALYRALAFCGVQKLDGVFLSHTHSDHIGGMEAVAQKYQVDTLYSAEISMSTKKGKNRIADLASALALPHVKLAAGDIIEIGPDAYFEVLGPLVYNDNDDNDNSLVVRMHAGGIKVLLTGDMQMPEEETLLQAGVDVSANVLKVGNHGNPDASSDAFLKAVNPTIAVVPTDSTVDTDTPATRILHALSGAQVHVTQDYPVGVWLTVNSAGMISVDNPELPSASADIVIQRIDKVAQTITLVNHGADYDLSGGFIFSVKGNEVFVFPQGAVIRAGQTLTVACQGGQGDYLWDDKKVWSDKEGEMGVLYGPDGSQFSRAS